MLEYGTGATAASAANRLSPVIPDQPALAV